MLHLAVRLGRRSGGLVLWFPRDRCESAMPASLGRVRSFSSAARKTRRASRRCSAPLSARRAGRAARVLVLTYPVLKPNVTAERYRVAFERLGVTRVRVLDLPGSGDREFL